MDVNRNDPAETRAPHSLAGEDEVLHAALREAQAAHHESEERLRTLLAYAPEAIVMLDTETGRFFDVNPRAEALFGLSRTQLAELGPVDVSPIRQPGGVSSIESANSIRRKEPSNRRARKSVLRP